VVEDLDAEELASGREAAGQSDIFLGWLWIAGGVVAGHVDSAVMLLRLFRRKRVMALANGAAT
jgi:hypothetical protein